MIVGIAMMRDEEDVAYHVVAHMAGEGLDAIVVADNGSTDGTKAELLRAKADLEASNDWCENHCSIDVVDDFEVGYYQSRKMTHLAQRAAIHGATWIVPFDADEIWYSDDRVSTYLKSVPEDVGVVNADLYNHFRTSLDAADPNPFISMQWRQPDPARLPKVAFRCHKNMVVLQGNHGVSGVDGRTIGGLRIRHFPYRSWDHFRRKAVNGSEAYAATDLPETEGAHWRGYGRILAEHGDDALKQVYDRYYDFLSPVDEKMVCDPAPFRRWLRG